MTQEQVTTRRLKRLRDVILPRIPRKQFDMKIWAEKTDCGTVACALGWAGLDPSFRKAGLVTNVKDDCVIYRGNYEIEAAELFFGITFFEVDAVFIKPKTRREVRAAITKIIRDRG